MKANTISFLFAALLAFSGAILSTARADAPLTGDSRTSEAEWNEFFHSKTGLFGANQVCKVAFDYTVIAREPKANFYVLARQLGSAAGSLGWTQWQGAPGQSGHIETTFKTRSEDNDILILGIQNKGALTVSHLTITTSPIPRPPDPPAPKRTWKSLGQTAYYVDSASGNDAHDGRSPQTAWRSLDRVNAGVFGPGDHILLKAGSRWKGFLSPGGSGAAGKPIVITRYGQGPKPAIDAAGKWLATVYLYNGEYWDITNLDVANRAPTPVPKLAGVLVRLINFGVAHRITLRHLDIHDVFGSNVKDEGGGSGILCDSGGDQKKTRYDGLRIENCRLARTDRNGITMSAYYARPQWPLSTHVVIRGNVLQDIGGDGIVPIGCDGCLIEHNVLRGGRQRAQDYAAGIWPWSCDNTVVQFNEVSGMKGEMDGEGYDSDYNSRGTLFQYNYSHDNDGGFMLICDDGSQSPPWNIGNSGTVIRYNISRNDGLHTFNITGPCLNTSIYNNVFYLGKGQDVPFVASGNWGGGVKNWPDDTRFVNNVFYAAGKSHFDFGGMTKLTFDHNAFWGGIAGLPADAHAILIDPKLAAPDDASRFGYTLFADPRGHSMRLDARGYSLRPDSPLRHAGAIVPDSGGRDYWGNPLPTGVPDIGAGWTKPYKP
jgi:hypothetical protein